MVYISFKKEAIQMSKENAIEIRVSACFVFLNLRIYWYFIIYIK